MTKAHVKIGFHTAVGGNPTGIGDHLTRLNQAGIPFFIKAADGMTGVFDAQNIMKNSSVPHTAVYRRSVPYEGAWPGYNPDVPDYSLDPETAAIAHWDYHKKGLPPELDKSLVWIETVNEGDKDTPGIGEWWGRFAIKHAQLCMAEGYKWAAFGWATGNPEPELWEEPAMLDFLRLCAEHSDKLAIALHEYSLTPNLDNGLGYLIGRFEQLHAVCDFYKIPRPNILITEFGWEYQTVPTPELAMPQLLEIAELYAQYPNILGAAIWYLGPGFGGIANQTQKLIAPLTDLILTTEFEVDPPLPPTPEETLGEFLERIAEENRVIDYNSLAALELEIVNDGFVPYGNEKWESYDGIQYAIQGARRLGIEPPERRVYYAVVGDWDNVIWVPQGNEPTNPPVELPLEVHDIVDQLEKHPTKTYLTRPVEDISTVTIHHTVGISTPESIASYHVNTNGWPGIGYHYVIEQDGKISLTNYPTTISYHAGVVDEQNNDYALGIALVGNFTSHPPTQAQIESARKLVDYLKKQLPRAKYVLPHRHMPGQTTQCPGATWQYWFDQITQPVILNQPVSIKFIPGELVYVTSTKLNIRETPNGKILGASLQGEKGTIQLDSPINKDGFDWWRISWGNIVGWSAEDYLAIGEVTLPPPSGGNKIDLLPYVRGNGVLYEVKNSTGSQERFQSQIVSDGFLQTKNTRAEKFLIKNGYIYRDWDTSPGNNRFYRLLENNIPGSPWIPQTMAEGESFTRSRKVQFYNWDCGLSAPNSGDVTDTMVFVKYYPTYTFRTGIKLPDVVELQWSGGEKYFYAKGYGLVAWERTHQDPNTPEWSAISEIHAPGQRPDNVVDLPNCLK